jgi:NAD-reducing hydrogenase small subunit
MDSLRKPRVATVWLGGCSGCHMSFLDLDERLLELGSQVDVVFTPIADVKQYPKDVDVVLVEGAIANEEHLHTIRAVRARTKLLV